YSVSKRTGSDGAATLPTTARHAASYRHFANPADRVAELDRLCPARRPIRILAVQRRIAKGVRERTGPEPIGGAGSRPCWVRTTSNVAVPAGHEWSRRVERNCRYQNLQTQYLGR
ncbi:MAG: hypothetical protein M3309_13630, partial [Actinomycetota bacterium]|nr:hypothetical protein [Actinomycetota bacterium]